MKAFLAVLLLAFVGLSMAETDDQFKPQFQQQYQPQFEGQYQPQYNPRFEPVEPSEKTFSMRYEEGEVPVQPKTPLAYPPQEQIPQQLKQQMEDQQNALQDGSNRKSWWHFW